MKKFSGILLFLVLVLLTAIIPVTVILFNPDVAGPESCLNYTVAGHQIPIGKSYRDAFFETLKQFQAGGIH